MTTIAHRYLLLALRLGRLVDGLVDFSFAPEELTALVNAEPAPDPATLRADARDLLADIAAGDLDPQRARWLAAQVEGLECVAQMLSGEQVPWTEAVRRCYGIEVEVTPESAFEQMHRRLDAALPGSGALADRLERWNESQQVPGEKLLDAFAVLADALRERTRALVELPEGERIDAVTVSGEPWAAYNWYLGGLASRIELNTDLPFRSYFFAQMVAHEGYPGHHTEHACKEARLAVELDRPEATIAVIHTPECLVSEGIAEVAVEQAWGERWLEVAAELLRPLGIPFDLPVAAEVVAAHSAQRAVQLNAAYFLNESGWSAEQAIAYFRKWSLADEGRAEKAVGFCLHPLWSAYVPTYSYGYRLVAAVRGARRRQLPPAADRAADDGRPALAAQAEPAAERREAGDRRARTRPRRCAGPRRRPPAPSATKATSAASAKQASHGRRGSRTGRSSNMSPAAPGTAVRSDAVRATVRSTAASGTASSTPPTPTATFHQALSSPRNTTA